MKILALAGSNSENSINKALVTYVSTLFKGHNINYLDLNDFEMPIYSIDREKRDGFPSEAYDFLNEIKKNDLVLLSLAEHNGAYTVAFKNVLDWCSRVPNEKVFQGKPMLLMSTSPGGRGGKSVLEMGEVRMPKMGANVISSKSFPSFNENFEVGKGIVNEKLDNEFRELVAHVLQSIEED